MDQVEAIAGVLDACARLARRISTERTAGIGSELFAASVEMDATARRLKAIFAEQRENGIGGTRGRGGTS